MSGSRSRREVAVAGIMETSRRLRRVLDMFPGRKHELLGLSLRDPLFRDLCDDLCEAHDSLERLLSLSGIPERPEVREYLTIIAELEAEVRQYVAAKCP